MSTRTSTIQSIDLDTILARTMQSSLWSGGLVAKVDLTVDFEPDNNHHINVNKEALNSSYESDARKATTYVANSSPRSVSPTSLFPFSFCCFSYSYIICFPSGKILHMMAVILLAVWHSWRGQRRRQLGRFWRRPRWQQRRQKPGHFWRGQRQRQPGHFWQAVWHFWQGQRQRQQGHIWRRPR